MAPALSVHPNVDAGKRVVNGDGSITYEGVLYLLSHPEAFGWLFDLLRATGGRFKFFDANILPHWHTDQRPDPLVTIEALIEIDAMKTLKALGIPTSVALGAIKSWDKNGEVCRDNARLAVDMIVNAGGDVPGLDIDEPWTWSTGGLYVPADPYYLDAAGQPRYAFVSSLVATFIRELRDFGVARIDLSESVPNNTPPFFVDRYREILADGQALDGWLWDIESGVTQLRTTAGKHLIASAGNQLRTLGISEVGYIVCPYGHRETQAEFAAGMLSMTGVIRAIGDAPDQIDVTCWHCRTSEKEGTVLLQLPGCLPASDQTSHLGVFTQVAQQWGATA